MPRVSSRLRLDGTRCFKGGALAMTGGGSGGSYPSPLVKSGVAREATIKGRHSSEAGIHGGIALIHTWARDAGRMPGFSDYSSSERLSG